MEKREHKKIQEETSYNNKTVLKLGKRKMTIREEEEAGSKQFIL